MAEAGTVNLRHFYRSLQSCDDPDTPKLSRRAFYGFCHRLRPPKNFPFAIIPRRLSISGFVKGSRIPAADERRSVLGRQASENR